MQPKLSKNKLYLSRSYKKSNEMLLSKDLARATGTGYKKKKPHEDPRLSTQASPRACICNFALENL